MTSNTLKTDENVTLEAERARLYEGFKQIYHEAAGDRRAKEYQLTANEILIRCMELLLGDDMHKYIAINAQPGMTVKKMEWFK